MSWSFYAVGKPAAVLNKARAELTRYKCSEPEETIKGKVLNILEASLLAFPSDAAVQIEACGSQTTDSSKPNTAVNTLSVAIKPLYGFVEDAPAPEAAQASS